MNRCLFHSFRVNINNTRIIKIEKWKKAHGEFESVEQFGKYNGFGTKSFEKTCDAILKAYEGECFVYLLVHIHARRTA